MVVCRVCSNPAHSQCGGCENAVYCGSECAKQDWHNGGHKHLCYKVNDIAGDPIALARQVFIANYAVQDPKVNDMMYALILEAQAERWFLENPEELADFLGDELIGASIEQEVQAEVNLVNEQVHVRGDALAWLEANQDAPEIVETFIGAPIDQRDLIETAFLEALSDIWEGFKSGVSKVYEGAKRVAQKGWEGVKKGAEAVKRGASKAWDATKRGASKAWEATKRGASKAAEAIKRGAQSAATRVKEFAGKAKEKVRELATKAKEKAQELAGKAKTKLGEWKEAAKVKFGEFKEKAKTKLGEWKEAAKKKAAELAARVRAKAAELKKKWNERRQKAKERAEERQQKAEQKAADDERKAEERKAQQKIIDDEPRAQQAQEKQARDEQMRQQKQEQAEARAQQKLLDDEERRAKAQQAKEEAVEKKRQQKEAEKEAAIVRAQRKQEEDAKAAELQQAKAQRERERAEAKRTAEMEAFQEAEKARYAAELEAYREQQAVAEAAKKAKATGGLRETLAAKRLAREEEARRAAPVSLTTPPQSIPQGTTTVVLVPQIPQQQPTSERDRLNQKVVKYVNEVDTLKRRFEEVSRNRKWAETEEEQDRLAGDSQDILLQLSQAEAKLKRAKEELNRMYPPQPKSVVKAQQTTSRDVLKARYEKLRKERDAFIDEMRKADQMVIVAKGNVANARREEDKKFWQDVLEDSQGRSIEAEKKEEAKRQEILQFEEEFGRSFR